MAEQFEVDDFGPSQMYLDDYPRIVVWERDNSLEDVSYENIIFSASIIDRQNSPDEDRYFIPSLQVSMIRNDGTYNNLPTESLDDGYWIETMEEAVDIINDRVFDIEDQYDNDELEISNAIGIDEDTEFEDWSQIRTPYDYGPDERIPE